MQKTWFRIGWIILGCMTVSTYAGSLDSPGAPTDAASEMYKLEDIYDRLDTGDEGAKSVFAEPSAGPGGTGRSLNEVMYKAPAVDSTHGAAAANVLAGKTFWGLLPGAGWGLLTGTADPAPVPKTGQTTSYRDNDDGENEKGIAWPDPRFTVQANTNLVADNMTGLMWTRNADIIADGNSWANAIDYCNAFDEGGYTDWRLPNVRELLSLIDYGRYDPALPLGHPFTNIWLAGYWSSSTDAETTTAALFVLLGSGRISTGDKGMPYRVWPVRGGD